jgi:hypothetical protein
VIAPSDKSSTGPSVQAEAMSNSDSSTTKTNGKYYNSLPEIVENRRLHTRILSVAGKQISRCW